MDIDHFNQVNVANITATFDANNEHRISLTIPFFNREDNKTICIIGQNPSHANQQYADKTIHYLEHYIYENHPQYNQIIILNLFSRIDTQKTATNQLLPLSAAREFRRIVKQHSDFLVVYGEVKNQKAYKFVKRAKQLRTMLNGKNVFKINLGTIYAPHPGNPRIWYGNHCFGLDPYAFGDVPP